MSTEATPLTAEEEAALRADIDADRWGAGSWSGHSVLRLLATLDRERAEHAALREKIERLRDEEWRDCVGNCHDATLAEVLALFDEVKG